MIVGIANAPNINAPDINFQNAMNRRNYVLNKVYENGFISKYEYKNFMIKETIIPTPPSLGIFPVWIFLSS